MRSSGRIDTFKPSCGEEEEEGVKEEGDMRMALKSVDTPKTNAHTHTQSSVCHRLAGHMTHRLYFTFLRKAVP